MKKYSDQLRQMLCRRSSKFPHDDDDDDGGGGGDENYDSDDIWHQPVEKIHEITNILDYS
jgi:hypothetical protein